ncbi:hypothetical protein [Halococcoides cellulosivorans]|uniref:Uncharacterized protein n=1 Tax=Halococcoides cellulosivorans TaxID=1679096 RepID=A0A2R4WZW1_9EURY|nr:hypothetical protein [Halococcoides cellulosivorans]AWB27061.1 hypothetical protein HARCEL1_04740 [Halococcoides cellulosivorans]
MCDASGDPFASVARPERHFAGGSVEYVGETVFALRPADPVDDLDGVVTDTLGTERYVAGDWFDLPATVYFVHDTVTGDVLRVGVRADRIDLHALPDTGVATLRALTERIDRTAETAFDVEPIATPE